ncbi:hypothetical protein OROHE_006133 [Orobanche hederae]
MKEFNTHTHTKCTHMYTLRKSSNTSNHCERGGLGSNDLQHAVVREFGSGSSSTSAVVAANECAGCGGSMNSLRTTDSGQGSDRNGYQGSDIDFVRLGEFNVGEIQAMDFEIGLYGRVLNLVRLGRSANLV